MFRIIFLVWLSIFSINGRAGEFTGSLFDRTYQDLKGFYIAEIGNMKRNVTSSGESIYQLNETCFVLNSKTIYSSKQASMLLVNKDEEIKVALFEDEIFGIKVSLEPISIIKCHQGMLNDLEIDCTTPEKCNETLNKLKKRNEELLESIELENKRRQLKLEEMNKRLKYLQENSTP